MRLRPAFPHAPAVLTSSPMRKPRFTGPATLLLAIPLLASCVAGPSFFPGVSGEPEWVVFPMERWYATERGEPEGLVACVHAACPNRMMVSVLRLRGSDAREARRVLDDPQRLAGYLLRQDREDENEERRASRISVETRDLEEAGFEGFAVTMTGARVAHGAILAKREGEELRVALAVGDDPVAVEAAARQIALEAIR